MFNNGDYIIYAGEGVCKIKAIGPVPIAYMDQTKTYYTLEPLYHSGVIYAPADSQVVMRPVLSRDEALELIKGIPDLPNTFTMPCDAKQAAAEYKTCLQTYDCANLLHLIRMLYSKREEAAANGRGYGQTDDRFYKRAKELLYGELALSLGVAVNEVEGEIGRCIEERANS